jgi:hypothetical protein
MKSANEVWNNVTKQWELDTNKALKNWTQAALVNGVVRWKVNDAVPFEDMLNDFATLGKIEQNTVKASNAARLVDTERIFKQYREEMKNHVHSNEEMSEMRANFGAGAIVVDVITGKRTRL